MSFVINLHLILLTRKLCGFAAHSPVVFHCTSVSCFDLWWPPCGTILFGILRLSCSMLWEKDDFIFMPLDRSYLCSVLWEKMILIWYHLTWYVICAVAGEHAGSSPAHVIKALYLRILNLEYVGYRFKLRYKMIVCWIQKPKNFDQY
jgi:hypothetical protein